MTKLPMFLALAIVAAAAPAHAQVPGEMTFTARLVDNGTPAEGNVALTFDVYRAASGGTSVWSESTTAIASLGLVAVQLGQDGSFDETVVDGGDLYLQIT